MRFVEREKTYDYAPIPVSFPKVVCQMRLEKANHEIAEAMYVHLEPHHSRTPAVVEHEVVHVQSRDQGDRRVFARHENDQRKLCQGEHC